MATEGKVHTDQDHPWHIETLAAVCRHDPILLLTTPLKIVDLADPEGQKPGVHWWLELTGRGGEGMVVKPNEFIATGPKGLAQPAVKCRGREYFRIIYGPEYTFAENLSRLRKRGLAAKRSLALGSLPWASRVSNGSCERASAAGPRVRFRRVRFGE